MTASVFSRNSASFALDEAMIWLMFWFIGSSPSVGNPRRTSPGPVLNHCGAMILWSGMCRWSWSRPITATALPSSVDSQMKQTVRCSRTTTAPPCRSSPHTRSRFSSTFFRASPPSLKAWSKTKVNPVWTLPDDVSYLAHGHGIRAPVPLHYSLVRIQEQVSAWMARDVPHELLPGPLVSGKHDLLRQS